MRNRSKQTGDVFYDNGERKKFQKLVLGNAKSVLSNAVQDIFISEKLCLLHQYISPIED